ncbi:MAG: type I DNA topoisomerase [Bacteroidales bacterium]
MAKNLVIVESPAKAKTIEGFLGKDYLVKSSFGHVMDLSKKDFGVNIEKDFTPIYEISSDKKKVVSELKKLAKDAEMVWLASDEDREGEAISWHLYNALKLNESNTKRIVFHEITKPAIAHAIENPRTIDKNLVDAQQARRVLDRLVGFELSPLLWKKVKPSLSAGRVQSVAVRLIVEREEEIKAFVADSSFRVIGDFILPSNKKLQAELNKRFASQEETQAFLESCNNSSFLVDSVEKKPGKKSPAAPFTTSTLQQEASRKLGFSVARTMSVAQRLYESGKITYMRTDSTNLSDTALAMASEAIKGNYGEDYLKVRKYQTKAKGAQEAHEAIRPTYFNVSSVSGSAEEVKLYELIWKRTIASQMSDAKLERTTINIKGDQCKHPFVAKGEVVVFDGFLKVYLESTDDENAEEQKGMLPAVSKNDSLKANEITATERFSYNPPRFTEASLVKKMEELGIGRPSTYAPTISTIQKREYVVKEDREGKLRDYRFMSLKDGEIKAETRQENTGVEKAKLFPTDIGALVNKFLIQYFDDILDYNFTASVEKEFDEIAQGQKVWNQMIKDFYKPFHTKVEKTAEESDRFSGERILGNDPVSGKPISVRIGRYGAMAQLGTTEEEDKPRFAGLRKGQSIESITLEEALELFKFPRILGNYEEEELSVAIGRFGPYVKHKGAFYSIGKTFDPLTIEQEDAILIIEAKREKDRLNTINIFEDEKGNELKLMNGRFGPYISYKKKNHKIPKTTDPQKLSFDDCLKLVEAAVGAKKATTKKTATKKTTAKKTTTKKAATKKTTAKKTATKKTTAKKAEEKNK